MKPIEAALEAWEKLPHVKKGESITADLLGHRVVKLHNIVLVMPMESDWPSKKEYTRENVKILAYPKPEDIVEFEKARLGVKRLGPADRNPGAIGTLHLILGMMQTGNVLFVKEAQNHYKRTTASKPVLNGLPDKLDRKYGTWLRHALTHAIEITKRRQLDLIVTNGRLYKGEERPLAPSHLHKSILKASEKQPFDFEYEADGLRIRH